MVRETVRRLYPRKMEEGSLSHQNGVQMAQQVGANNKQQGEEANNPKAQYSIPGILHFIQHEWARFELERSQWEVDRAELQVGGAERRRAFVSDGPMAVIWQSFCLKNGRFPYAENNVGC